jgi:uncharacterized protein (DUF58 family)
LATVFPLIPRRRVIGLAFGGVRSARRGIGSDVASSRPYHPGDDVGWIDWAASARLSAARGSDEFIVRERFADEAPRVVVLADRPPSMSIGASRLRSLDKPQALLTAIDLIAASAVAARSLTGYLDYADGEPFWRPPRTEHRAEAGTLERGFAAARGSITHGLDFLAEHRRDLPTQAFVFVLSDFLEAPDMRAWERALEHRWDIVPVVIQDPVWERTFPDVGGIAVPYADPTGRGVSPVFMTRKEARRVRERHEARWNERIAAFRSLGLEPVLVGTHHAAGMLDAFLAWADLRMMSRGPRG